MLVMVIIMKVMLMMMIDVDEVGYCWAFALWEVVGGWVYHLADDIHFSICTRKQVLKYKIQNTEYKYKIQNTKYKKKTDNNTARSAPGTKYTTWPENDKGHLVLIFYVCDEDEGSNCV